MRLIFTLIPFVFIVLNGCSSIQNYKPLYQETPEKQEIKKKK